MQELVTLVLRKHGNEYCNYEIITMYIWMDSCTCNSKVLWMGSSGIPNACDPPATCYATPSRKPLAFLSQTELQPSDATQDGIPVGEILGQTS